jgi:hypothetical protein
MGCPKRNITMKSEIGSEMPQTFWLLPTEFSHMILRFKTISIQQCTKAKATWLD